MSLFISYSTKDSDFVDNLSKELIKKRIHVWLDKWEMQPGDSLIDKIQDGITESSFLLVVLSKNSVKSEWCRKELNSGLMRELNEKKVVVIPVLIEDCEIPLFLQEKVYADFKKDFEEGFKQLIRPLSKLFSEHMGRSTNDDIITDYSINWGLNEEDEFYTHIDLVNWYKKASKSILLQIFINGCEKATQRYISQTKLGYNWTMKETLISVMAKTPAFTEMNILTKNDEVYNNYLTLQDDSSDIKFYFHIRAILMGEDDGNDVLINLVDFIKMLNSTIPERME